MESPAVVRGLIDTSILVDYRTGEPNAMAFLHAIRQIGPPELSAISAMILVTNCADSAESTGLGWFFLASDVHAITARISRQAFLMLQHLAPPCGLTADDAIVAATAIDHSLPPYTLDPARFAAVPKLTAIRPY